MKIVTGLLFAAAVFAGAGAASAQTARNSFESVVPFANGGPVYTGRSAFAGGSDTSRTYGVGADGQGVLAPHINGVF